MNPTCDAVAERVALGDPLDEHADHAVSCERCRRVVAMPGMLGTTKHAIDPGLGFAARMTVGAQQLIAVRRRRRIVGGLAAGVVVGALAVFVVTRTPTSGRPIVATDTSKDESPIAASEDDLKMLVDLADTDRSSRVTARWRDITKPLRPYRRVVKGVTP